MPRLSLPLALILFRFLCAPVMLILAWQFGADARGILLVLLYLGLISDILDGIVARFQGEQSELMRRLDSQTDMIFWVSAGFCAWMLNPEPIRANWIPVIAILIMEAACYVVSILRFGRETCTHAWLAKFWGLTLLAAFTMLLGFGEAGFWFDLCVVVGLISHLDVILIILILPRWTHDVPSAYHAWLIRRNIPFKKYKIFNG